MKIKKNIKTIVFYSLKGGTGRSLALANVAYAMVRAGKSVLCIDMDIEAPGLIDMFGLNSGNIEFTTVELLNKPEKVDELIDEFSISGIAVNIGKEFGYSDLKGELFVIPAKREKLDEIRRAVQNKLSPESSRLQDYFTDAFVRAIKKISAFLEVDYILLDARSGISQEAMYTLGLGDEIVLNMRLDKQGRSGVEYIYKFLKECFGELGVDIMLVASNVPIELETEVRSIVDEVENKVNDKIRVIVPHDLRLILEEELVVRTRPNSIIAKKYYSLADIIIEETQHV